MATLTASFFPGLVLYRLVHSYTADKNKVILLLFLVQNTYNNFRFSRVLTFNFFLNSNSINKTALLQDRSSQASVYHQSVFRQSYCLTLLC